MARANVRQGKVTIVGREPPQRPPRRAAVSIDYMLLAAAGYVWLSVGSNYMQSSLDSLPLPL